MEYACTVHILQARFNSAWWPVHFKCQSQCMKYIIKAYSV